MGPTKDEILIIGINYSPEHTGIAPYSTALAENLSKQGFPATVVTAQPHYPKWVIQPEHRIWRSKSHFGGVLVTRVLHYVPRQPKGLKRLISEITFGMRAVFTSWKRPSHIVLVSPALFSSAICMLKARLFFRGVPAVLWVQDLYAVGLAETGQGAGITFKVLKRVEGWLLRSASSVVVIHEKFSERVQNDYGVDPNRISVVRNWAHKVLTAGDSESQANEVFDWVSEGVVVLHTGNMGVKQGLENVVEAARLAETTGASVRFVLMGDGSERKRLEALASGLTTLKFAEPVATNLYQSALKSADILLVNELEGVSEMAAPSKLTSYFQSGTPVLAATSLSGITSAEVERAGAGVVIPAGNPKKLLEAVLKLGSDPSLREASGISGQVYAANFLSEETAIAAFKSLFRSLASEGR